MIEFNSRQRIIWLASYPRSGNTWTRAFLFCLYHVFRNKDFDKLDFSRLNDFSVWDNSLVLFRKYLKGPPHTVDDREIAALRPRVFADLARQSRGAVLVKTHNARMVAHGTPFIEDSVTAGAIYIVRNPLDVAISFANFRGISIDQAISDMATRGFGHLSDSVSVYWVTDSWSRNVKSWTHRTNPRTLIIRYEDLRDKPEMTFGKVARHLLMKPTQEQISKAIELTTFENLKQREEAEDRAAQRHSGRAFFRSGKAGQWRDVLTKEQVDRVIHDHGELMKRFAYLPGKR